MFPTGTAGVTGIRFANGFDVRPVLAILNSPLLSAYALGRSPGYQGGFHKFSQPYIENLPIRVPQGGTSPTWERLAVLWNARMAVEHGPNRAVIDARISDLVLELYEVTADELRSMLRGVEPLAAEDFADDSEDVFSL